MADGTVAALSIGPCLAMAASKAAMLSQPGGFGACLVHSDPGVLTEGVVMPQAVAVPSPAASIERFALAVDAVRGAEGAGYMMGQMCFADDSE